MPKICILIVIVLVFSNAVKSQDFTLVGVLDNHLVSIDSLTGQVAIYKDFQNFPNGENIADLTYHNVTDIFYSIRETSSSPSLVSISTEGEYQIIAPLTIGGIQIALAEALAYNVSQNKLYAAVSLNGGALNNDFYSESIVEVNPSTGECTFITEISTNHSNPDIDVMTFLGDELFIADGAPPGANFLSIYKLDFQNINSVSNPSLEYESTYLPIRDFTATSQSLYFTEERNLRQYSISNNTIEFIGVSHAAGEFNGAIIQGISKMKICSLPQVDLGADQNLCESETLLLDATNADGTFMWQNGSSNSTYLVTESGSYWVEVENSCGISSDTIEIMFETKPYIDLGEDTMICNNIPLILEVAFTDASYEWQDGSNQSIYEVTQSGVYWVTAENICGVYTDSIRIDKHGFENILIPNVITPNGDSFNEQFEIDTRLVGSKIEIFQRWGKMVFESKNYQNNWSGLDLSSGIYYYFIVDNCGNSYKGWVQIIH